MTSGERELLRRIKILERRISGGGSSVDAAGALDGNGSVSRPLSVRVDNDTIVIINNQLVAVGGSPGGSPGFGSGQEFIQRTVLTSGTGATHTLHALTQSVFVRVIGGGGGGGGSDGTTAGCSAGGNAGAYAEKWYATVTGGTGIEYTIGALGGGGTAGNNAGTGGGTTTWDNNAELGGIVTAQGGGGGGSMATGTTVAAGVSGAQGTASGGDINIPGRRANNALRGDGTSFSLSAGADSPLGAGGVSGVNSAAGVGAGYGAGGGGNVSTSGVADQAGGDGSPGVIIVDEFG